MSGDAAGLYQTQFATRLSLSSNLLAGDRAAGGRALRLRREFQTAHKGTGPQKQSRCADRDVQTRFECVVQCGEWQRRAQAAMKPGQQQSAESYEGDGAAKCQPRHDKDITQGKHNSPRYLLTG
jgi:hypothetical protein